jgi:hypothetical protein
MDGPDLLLDCPGCVGGSEDQGVWAFPERDGKVDRQERLCCGLSHASDLYSIE